MSRKCQLTGRGPRVGNKVSHSHRISKRRWNINLQKVRVLVDGRVMTMRVCTKAIKSGLIEKPPITIRERKPKLIKPQAAELAAAAMAAEDELIPEFFSTKTAVTRLFKPKKKDGAKNGDPDSDDNRIFGEDIAQTSYDPVKRIIDDDEFAHERY